MEESRYNYVKPQHLEEQHVSVLQDVDEVLTTQDTAQKGYRVTDNRAGSKMEHAKQVSAKTIADLRTLVEGVNTKISSIGVTVADAQQFQGAEKVFNVLGHMGFKWAKDRADVSRHDRIQQIDLRDAVKEIENYVHSTIVQLGESEQLYKLDEVYFKHEIDKVLAKQAEATPLYTNILPARAKLEAEVSELDGEINAGTLDVNLRPQKEKEYETKKRELNDMILKESNLANILKEAQEAIPTLQKNREAASMSIRSIHGMRTGLFEKFNNLKVVLETASTSMKARATAELYSAVDPAMNKTVESITDSNIANAGAIVESWSDRLKHANIDPEVSQRLLADLLGHINDSVKALSEAEDKIKANPTRTWTNGESR